MVKDQTGTYIKCVHCVSVHTTTYVCMYIDTTFLYGYLSSAVGNEYSTVGWPCVLSERCHNIIH